MAECHSFARFPTASTSTDKNQEMHVPVRSTSPQNLNKGFLPIIAQLLEKATRALPTTKSRTHQAVGRTLPGSKSTMESPTSEQITEAFIVRPCPRVGDAKYVSQEARICKRCQQHIITTPLPRSAPTPTPPPPPPPRTKRVLPKCNAESKKVPDTADLLVQSWVKSRSISATVDLSRRFISVLFLSNYCQRAAFAEKKLAKVAEKYSISRRLLILSAGIFSQPGDLLPWRLVAAARERDIDLSDERPCASFEITDLDYYDFVVVLDQNVRDKVIRMAEASAHTSGGHLYDWERKIRLLCDFDGVISSQQSYSSPPLDVPSFDSDAGFTYSMDAIDNGCEQLIRSLVAAGL